ncbi:MAG TPA: YceI family protein [Bryobacteraceae bacterium]|nr:YceI family protein [Bryobacteraceae bacterium]
MKGWFNLTRGTVEYDFASGKSSGKLVIDARSGQSGNGARDKRMHRTILESDRYPENRFYPGSR